MTWKNPSASGCGRSQVEKFIVSRPSSTSRCTSHDIGAPLGQEGDQHEQAPEGGQRESQDAPDAHGASLRADGGRVSGRTARYRTAGSTTRAPPGERAGRGGGRGGGLGG